ncbi:MAG: hypothetical protein ABIO38_07220, partial [Luteimonas sp.]
MPDRTNFAMTRLPWIVAAVAVIALFVTLLSIRNPGAGRATDGDEANQALLARIEALENSGQGAGPPSPQRGASAAGMGQGQVGGNGSETLAGGPQKTPEQMEADRKRELQALEAAFARDKADPVRGG